MKIDGREIADKILLGLRKRVEKLKAKNPSTGHSTVRDEPSGSDSKSSRQGIIPHLAVVLVGNDPASSSYVNQKMIKGKSIGAKITIKYLPQDISESKLLATIEQFNNDNNVHGVIIQRPLPKTIDADKISIAIDPKKDVDGFHPSSKFQPPIALAVLRILEEIYSQSLSARHSGEEERRLQNLLVTEKNGRDSGHGQNDDFTKWLISKKIAVMGKGETGGKPIIDGFEKMGIEASVIDSKTKNPLSITKNADIIISAVGKPNVIKPEMIKKDVILIGVGLFKGEDGKMHGDYHEEEIKNIASFYTTTPGGVGPLNVAMLLKNLVSATENFSSLV